MMNVRDFEYPALVTLQRGPNVGYDLSYPTWWRNAMRRSRWRPC